MPDAFPANGRCSGLILRSTLMKSRFRRLQTCEAYRIHRGAGQCRRSGAPHRVVLRERKGRLQNSHCDRFSAEACRRGPHLSGTFWFTNAQAENPPVRDRAMESGATLKAASISNLEIDAALRIARDDNACGNDADLVRTAARLLGFKRVGADLRSRLLGRFMSVRHDGRVIECLRLAHSRRS
jgi:hypothetical protein